MMQATSLGVWQAMLLSEMSLVQHLSDPPSRLPQPDPPHDPQLAAQHTFVYPSISLWIPQVHMSSALVVVQMVGAEIGMGASHEHPEQSQP